MRGEIITLLHLLFTFLPCAIQPTEKGTFVSVGQGQRSSKLLLFQLAGPVPCRLLRMAMAFLQSPAMGQSALKFQRFGTGGIGQRQLIRSRQGIQQYGELYQVL